MFIVGRRYRRVISDRNECVLSMHPSSSTPLCLWGIGRIRDLGHGLKDAGFAQVSSDVPFLMNRSYSVTSLCWVEDASFLAVGTSDGLIVLVDPFSLSSTSPSVQAHKSSVLCLCSIPVILCFVCDAVDIACSVIRSRTFHPPLECFDESHRSFGIA